MKRNIIYIGIELESIRGHPNTDANESRFVSTIEDILYKEALGFIEIVKQNKRDNENNGSDQNNK